VPDAANRYATGPRTEADGGLAIERPPELGGIRRYSHEAMATVFEVYAAHPSERYAAQAAQAAFDLADRLERELSRFLSNRDVARVNDLAAGESVRVSPSTLECLVIARHMFDLTGGAFDVSIGTGLPSLELDPDDFLVHATTSGVRVDLGGIGKGYAADLMAELLEEWGVQVALVHGGFSSVLALEPPAGRDDWPLTLSDPAAPTRALARLSARQTALSASGLRKGDHILDPRTGDAVHDRIATWVALPRPQIAARVGAAHRVAAAAVADALTTAFMLLTTADIEGLCERTPGLEAWLLSQPASGTSAGPELLHFGGAAE